MFYWLETPTCFSSYNSSPIIGSPLCLMLCFRGEKKKSLFVRTEAHLEKLTDGGLKNRRRGDAFCETHNKDSPSAENINYHRFVYAQNKQRRNGPVRTLCKFMCDDEWSANLNSPDQCDRWAAQRDHTLVRAGEKHPADRGRWFITSWEEQDPKAF